MRITLAGAGYKHPRRGQVNGDDLMVLGSTILCAASTIAGAIERQKAKGAEAQNKPAMHAAVANNYLLPNSESELKTPS